MKTTTNPRHPLPPLSLLLTILAGALATALFYEHRQLEVKLCLGERPSEGRPAQAVFPQGRCPHPGP